MDTRSNDGTAGRHWLRSHPGPPPPSSGASNSSLFDVPAGYPTVLNSGNGNGNHGNTLHAPAAVSSPFVPDGNAGSLSVSTEQMQQQPNSELSASQQARSTRRSRRGMFQGDPGAPHLSAHDQTVAATAQAQSQPHHVQYAQQVPQHAQQQQQHFAVPSVPTSAPATTSNFFQDTQHVARPSIYGLPASKHGPAQEPQRYPYIHSQSHLIGRGHGRSASAVSATPSQSSFTGGPLSASTSSAASSNYGDAASTSSLAKMAGSRSAGNNRLTADDRRELCLYAEKYPRMKHDSIGKFFGIERSTVSKILKNRAKWLGASEESLASGTNSPLGSGAQTPSSPSISSHHELATQIGVAETPSRGLRQRTGRHPQLEAALARWGWDLNATGVVTTDEQVRNQALEIAQQKGLDSGFKASSGWLENFKQRWNYRNGKFHSDPSLVAASMANPPPLDIAEMERERATPVWPAPSPGGSSSSAFFSPAGHRSRAATGQSLSGSSISLPGLAEEAGDTDENWGGLQSSQHSSSSSFSQHDFQPSRPKPYRDNSSYSGSCSSPNPSTSGYSSMAQEEPLHMLHHPRSTQFSTPTQRLPYSTHEPTTPWESPAFRLQQAQQAGLNFQLTLNSNDTPVQHGGDVRHQRQLSNSHALSIEDFESSAQAGRNAFEGAAYPSGAVDGIAADTASNATYALRSRMQSAPGSSMVARAPRLRNPTYPASSPVPSDNSLPLASLHTRASQLPQLPQQKAPLLRSHTDPMPIMQTLQEQQDQLELEYQAQAMQDSMMPQNMLDSTNSNLEDDGATSMQIDSVLSPEHNAATLSLDSSFPAYPVANSSGIVAPQIHPPSSHHPRRATISTGSDASTAYATFGSYYGPQLVIGGGAPVFAQFGDVHHIVPGNSIVDPEKVSFDDAHQALRTLFGYLQKSSHDSNSIPHSSSTTTPVANRLAAPEDLRVLEHMLSQFRQAQIARSHTLTPPSSQ